MKYISLPLTIVLALSQISMAHARQDDITVTIQGMPTHLSSLKVTLQPNNNFSPIIQNIHLNQGKGSGTFSLPDGGVFTLQTQAVAGYVPTYSPQQLAAATDKTANISFSKLSDTAGRLITYVPTWKALPPAQELSNAGYTHAIIAFGVFSTSKPGVIVSSFNDEMVGYIQGLHRANLKVLLSLGGASSSLPNTVTDFHQVLSAASSPDIFKETFISSLHDLIVKYDFDGFDIDIETGLNSQGSFAQPSGDIAVLADIINTMYLQNEDLLISLAPQAANISATSGFDGTWGNYAALIMKTYPSLAWVGIQIYNTGCVNGVNGVCYDQTKIDSPDFSVAMAVDLLSDWPAKLPGGQASGFQPYIAYLKPSQIVLGYPAPNASGKSDGQAVIPTSTIKHAIQCLSMKKNCDTYTPPTAYGSIGGVFEWEISYDKDNNYKFATDLKKCVIDANCD
ncbi:MAG: glycosyl hydrolase family 18 protein [Legionellales bacterium]|nr:glycosyl hydrolase family 18 protein [Legionellales bacterium]